MLEKKRKESITVYCNTTIVSMNMDLWLKEMTASKENKPLPILSFPAIQLVDYSMKDLVTNAVAQGETIRALLNRVDMPAAIMFMDLSVEAEAFGSPVAITDDDVPTVTDRILVTDEDIDSLKVPKVGDARTQIYIDAVKETKKRVTDRPTIAGVIGPFTLAGRLFDMTEIMIKSMIEPEAVKKVLEKITVFLIDYVKALKEAGANGVCIAEPAAGLLSPDLNKDFSVPFNKQIVDAVQDETFTVIYHNCGNIDPLIDDILKIGAKALHFGNETVMDEIIQVIPTDVIVMGNIDAAAEFRHGTPQSIAEVTKDVLSKCSKHPNFVLSSGCDIPCQTSFDNIDAFFKAASAYCS